MSLSLVGDSVELTPINVNTSPNTPATFTCSVSCQFSQTHTISWFVGLVSSRRVQQGNELLNQDLNSRTGLRVDFTTLQRCTSTDPNARQVQQLRLTTRSLGRTPVQCAALSNGPSGDNHYSQYGLMFALGKSQILHKYCTLPCIIKISDFISTLKAKTCSFISNLYVHTMSTVHV